MSLCSRCSTPVLPIVAWDVDGTLSEYHRAIAEFVWRYFDMKKTAQERMLAPPWDGDGDYEDWIGVTQTQYREAKLAFRQGGFKRWAACIPGIDEALLLMQTLKADPGVEVWITTTRPWNRLDNVDPDTRWWLDKHFPVYDHLLFGEDKYTDLAQRVDPSRVVAIVEDLPQYYQQAVREFGTYAPILISRPHNLEWDPNSVVRATMPEVLKRIQHSVNYYHELNGVGDAVRQ